MKKIGLISIMSLSLLLGACGGNKPWRTYKKVSSDTLYAKQVIEQNSDFIMGMDVSSVLAEEASGVKYYDFEGNEADLFKVLSDNGVNYIRVRVWNNPFDDNGKGFGGGNNDINAALEIGKRATKYNMKLLVDFHYSDFWADPGKQTAPRAWANMDMEAKTEALYTYTKESLQLLKKNKVDVGMVQVGNETNNGRIAGERTWLNFCTLVGSGSKAVREVYPDAKVAVHFTNPEKNGQMIDFASKLNYYETDYDVFGTSWYPWWHGTLDNLSETLSTIAETYEKKVMVMETSYANSYYDYDFGGNTSPTAGDVKLYPITVAGQANHVNILTDYIANKTTNGIGICYWEGAWITVGQFDASKADDSEYSKEQWEANSAKWEQYGSGWASSYAEIYDKDVALYGPGGSMVDNQAFFDENGKPLESLKMFNLVRFGNDAPLYVDGVDDVELLKYTTDEFTLPATIKAVFSDNSKRDIPVQWEAFDIPAAKSKGNGKYTISGVATAEGKTFNVELRLSIMEKNFLANYSFEDGEQIKESTKEHTPWVITNNCKTKEIDPPTEASPTYTARATNENPQTGSYNLNFWSKNREVMNFDITQKVVHPELVTGNYKFQFSMKGGFGGDVQNIYSYVKVDGVVVAQLEPVKIPDDWTDFLLTGISYTAGQELVVGIHVEASGEGVWGTIDDCMLNLVL